MKRKKLIVMGFMGACPIAGVIWQHLHYIVGLQRLGHDVYYIEDSTRHPYDPELGQPSSGFEYASKVFAKLAVEFGFERRWSYCARYIDREATAGMPRARVQQLYRDADAILNVCGAQEVNDDLIGNDRLLYIDSDPGVEQIKIDQASGRTTDYLRQHRALFTFGENVGTDDFAVPVHAVKWMPTRQPVVTDFWRTTRPPAADAVFTTIVNWNTTGLKDIEWRGQKYLWSKAPQFLRFLAAPARTGEAFELAVGIKEADTRRQFEQHGWRLRDAYQISSDCAAYRKYVQRSKGEFTVAKDQYVRLRSGWFSDRSACYLAAGRPVVTQDTGFTRHYGGGDGLFAFSSLDEVAEAVQRIKADHAHHSRAASELAREFFEAEKVLSSLLVRAGI